MQDIPNYTAILFTVYAAIALAFVSPGPNFLGVVSAAVDNRSNGVLVGLGISVGTALWAILAVTGIAAIVWSSQTMAAVLAIMGALYLGWLGIKSLKGVTAGAGRITINSYGSSEIRPSESFARGLTIQMTNPKSAVFWLAVTSAVLVPGTPINILIALVVGCFAIAVVWHVALALVFSSAPARAGYLRAKPIISLLFGLFFIFLGVRIIVSVVSPLVT